MNQHPAELYHVEERSSTAGSGACVLLAASLAFVAPQPMPRAAFPAVNPVVRPSTVGQFGNLFAGAYLSQTVDFEGAVSAFYATLLAKQQPLGKEFEKVLYDNLWDLYVRS
jgi:hypothetical protein